MSCLLFFLPIPLLTAVTSAYLPRSECGANGSSKSGRILPKDGRVWTKTTISVLDRSAWQTMYRILPSRTPVDYSIKSTRHSIYGDCNVKETWWVKDWGIRATHWPLVPAGKWWVGDNWYLSNWTEQLWLRDLRVPSTMPPRKYFRTIQLKLFRSWDPIYSLAVN